MSLCASRREVFNQSQDGLILALGFVSLGRRVCTGNRDNYGHNGNGYGGYTDELIEEVRRRVLDYAGKAVQ